MPARVSVVIPAYNSVATVSAAIESVLRQTVEPAEVIVVDDGSSDRTIEQVTRFEAPVRYVRQQHGGVAAARNRGLAEAQGDYVAFLDADDLWLRHKLEQQLAVFEEDPRTDAVQCSVYLVNNSLEVVGVNDCSPSHDTLEDFLLFRNLAG